MNLKNFILKRDGDRTKITTNLLLGKKFENGIDVGGRKSEILNELDVNNKFTLDFHNDPNPTFTGNVLKHNLEYGLPYAPKKQSWNLIIANDVIEHVENKNKLTDDLFKKCSGDLVISLPNTQHYYYLRGLFFGRMSKQYVFDIDDGVDRHRWITYYNDNKSWLSKKAKANKFELINYKETWITVSLLHLLLHLHPRKRKFFVFNQIFHFRKK